jgi:hypothetical protein
MRQLNQRDALKEKDYFSKKKGGTFTLSNLADGVSYPQRFLVTGNDDFDSGVLGVSRGRRITHVRVTVSGTPHRNVSVVFIGGHYHKRKKIEDYAVDVPTLEGENTADVRINKRDYGIIFVLTLAEGEFESNPINIAREFKVNVTFEFIKKRRFLFFTNIFKD